MNRQTFTPSLLADLARRQARAWILGAAMPLGALTLTSVPSSAAGLDPATSASAQETSQFGEPLFVNGRRVSDNDIKRFIIYGPGRLMLELYRINLIIDDELDRRSRDAADQAVAAEIKQRAGENPTPEALAAARAQPDIEAVWQSERERSRSLLNETLSTKEEEFEAEYKRTLDEFKKNYPSLNIEAEVSRAFRNIEWYRVNLRQLLMFDRVFYPENPEEWPITSIESVRADSGDVLLDDAKSSYKMRKEHAEKTGEPLPKEDNIYVQMMRQIVRDALYNTINFQTAFDGLPDTLLLTADKDFDGKPELVVTTDEVWQKVQDTVTPVEIEEAKQWYATSIATHDRLKSEGFLLDEAGRKDALAAIKKGFENTYFNLDILATQTYFFPSNESYLDYHMLMEGYKKRMGEELKPQENGDISKLLRGYLDRANRIMGLGQIDLDCMLISAFDVPNFQWKPNGWAWAKGQADMVKQKLDANIAAYNEQRAEIAKARAEGREFKPETEVKEPALFWADAMNDHSEYWDPPSPEQGRGSDVGMKNRGRFGLRYRNDLQGFVGETPYRHWVVGESITDYTFFEQAEGTIAGPFKGPHGYYITRVARRLPPSRPLNLGEPMHVKLLTDDYLRVSFVDYAKEARQKADIKGLAQF